MTEISQQDADLLFNNARTHNGWLDKPVPDQLLRRAYNLAKMGPTSANCQPMRVYFIKSADAKARLKPYLLAGNTEKTLSAPVTAIIAHDNEFYNYLPELFPHADAKSWFKPGDEKTKTTAFRNGSLQGAYFILALRALGLDTGPMSGFDNDGVDKEFFANTSYKSNFLVNIGYGDVAKLFPRSPRPSFEQFCKIL